MPRFGRVSLDRLATCHPDLQLLMARVVEAWDCKIDCGYRGKPEQDRAVKDGRSKTPWPRSKHNRVPALAVDAYPYPVDLKNRTRIIFFAGFVLGVAEELYRAGEISHKVRSGADWNRNRDPEDDGWDCPHFELEV